MSHVVVNLWTKLSYFLTPPIDLVDPDETQVATADSDVKPRKIAKVQKVDKIEEEKENEGEEGEKKEGEEKEAPGE